MIQQVTGFALRPFVDVSRHNQAAHIVHQEMVIKCGILKGKLTPCYKDESQFVLSGAHIINCTVTGL